MKIERVALEDQDTLRELHAAAEVTHRHDRPPAPFWTEAEMLALLRPDDPEERFVPLLARDDDGTVAGNGLVFVPLLDNTDKVYAHLSVQPEWRGRGVGDAMVEELIRLTRDEGRPRLLATGYFPGDADETHPVRAFASRHGFSLANTEVRRVLQLPVDEEVLRGWVAEAAEHHEGYAIELHHGLVPPHLRASLVELENQLNVDAPTGDIDFEAAEQTVEIYEEQTGRLLSTGRRILVALAVRDGEAVAHSTLSVPPGDSEVPHVSQWGTYVHRDHRGHRLGMATKAANLLALQQRFPERTLVHTTNSPVNGPMVAINERIGFRPVEVMGEFLLEV